MHLSVLGAYRWSPNPLNKQSFHLDIHVRRLRVPWTMLRVSCYHDEIIEGHVLPPDQKSPHPIHPSSRYSPVSRRDTARVVCNIIPDLIPNRTWLLGGPKVYQGNELNQSIAPFKKSNSNQRTGRTKYGPLPHGDFSVAPETSEVMVGWIPTETLEWQLDPQKHPIPENPSPFWNRPAPQNHWSDQGDKTGILKNLPDSLRFALHQGLCSDLTRVDISNNQDIYLDFTQASWKKDSPKEDVLRTRLQAIENIQVLKDGHAIYTGDMEFIFDELADSFHVWWSMDENMPVDIWNNLDLGMKRRLSKNQKWNQEPLVRNFLASSHERVQL